MVMENCLTRNFVRAPSFKIHNKFGWIVVQTLRSWITAVRSYFVLATRAKAHTGRSPISRQAVLAKVLGQNSEVSREHLCTYLSVSFRKGPRDIHTVTGPKWRWRDWLGWGMWICALDRFYSKLICRAQFVPLWKYLNVWPARRSLFFSDAGNSNWYKHFILLMKTVTD